MDNSKNIKLTQYSHGAGCGCKISQSVLDKILAFKNEDKQLFPSLLVGKYNRDDAAVMDIGGGSAIISTTDFFMPIVDDPFDFGRIAAVNSISDVYAMGGEPILAIGILGWPIDKLSPEIANLVMSGAKSVCKEAGIPIGGGHSIDSPEPIFGLAVTGKVLIENLKRNEDAKPGDLIYLTKPLGVGILSTAQKKNKLLEEHNGMAEASMLRPNKIGAEFGTLSYVHALTDVTGFGLLGHLSEICEASNVSAKVDFNSVPTFDPEILKHYLSEGCIPGGTIRNYESINHLISEISDEYKNILCDPQTSGGLLVTISPEYQNEFEKILKDNNLPADSIGVIEESKKGDYLISCA